MYQRSIEEVDMAQNHQINPKSLIDDSLYCSEEHFEDDHEYNVTCPRTTIKNTPFVVLQEQDMFWDEEELESLLAKEKSHNRSLEFSTFLEGNKVLDLARREALEWILRVNAHYSFSALTAVLAVNYLDRFLFGFKFVQNEKPWLTHLAAVACISLACKVEETHLPLSVDLQVEESRYVFEAKTIKRMEILVLSTLGWKMNPATPLSFIDYFTRRLGLKGYLCFEFLRRCEAVLLSVFADSRFMCYLPSVLATATMMHVINNVEPCLGDEYQNQLLGILGINKDKVEECYKLILGCKEPNNKRKFGGGSIIIPGSPSGVMDVSFSSDSSNDSWDNVAASSPKKARRTQDQKILLNHNSNQHDFLINPH